MAKEKYTVETATRSLSKKKDVKVSGNTVQVIKSDSPRYTGDLGNGSWGRIDYLVNHMGYTLIKTGDFA